VPANHKFKLNSLRLFKVLALAALLSEPLAHCGTNPVSATLEIVSPPNSTVGLDDSFTITVVAHGRSVTLLGATFDIRDDATGKVLNDAFSLQSDKNGPLLAETPATVYFHVDQSKLTYTLSANASLVLLFKAQDSAPAVPTSAWKFTLVRGGAELSVSSRPNEVTRPYPFRPFHLAVEDKACLWYTLSPPPFSLAKQGKRVTGDPFTTRADASSPQNVTIDAVFSTDNRLCFDATIPSQLPELKAKFRVQDISLKKPVDFEADLRIKDHWGWRFLAAVVATVPAFLVVLWTTTIRRRILNRNQRDELTGRLAQFLASNPALANHDSVVFIRQMIVDSGNEDKAGDFDSSAQNLASASSRMDQLVATPPAVPTPVSQSGQAIRILNPPNWIVSGRRVSFTIGQPDPNWPKAGGTYVWSVADSDGNTETQSSPAVDQRSFSHNFSKSGPFTVTVTVNGANPESRAFNVLSEPPPGAIKSFKIAQYAIYAFTFLLAAGTAYVSTQDLLTFGTFGDYLRLFMNVFGVSGSAGGVATVLTAIRGR
jgi:PKD domain